MQPTMTFRQAFNKVTEAYFKGEIVALDSKFCFCGTLCDNSDAWALSVSRRIHHDYNGFKGNHFVRMERALFDGIWEVVPTYGCTDHPLYETALFNGMSAAIDEMRLIYIEEGWPLGEDEAPALTLRKVLNAYEKNK